MTEGRVFLVGAGPGAPGLVTARGLAVLREADVVVYDRLAPNQLLAEAPTGTELIYVGKRPDQHTLTQEEINDLLAQRASQGQTVVRLKGGDPYVFGRGGEEAQYLNERGISFEVVPGITSAIAVPSYAGIPLTHRDAASSFTVVTGHERPDRQESAINWEKLATASDTLVFLMGVGNLPHIVNQLVKHGRSASTPVALTSWGTTAGQRTVSGTLENIVSRIDDLGLEPPAVTVVGDVVAFRSQLNWFETKPLFGRRVVVTRARSQASRMTAALEELGAEVLELPLIRILPPTEAEKEKLSTSLSNIEKFDWIVFTSANAVRSVFEVLREAELDLRNWRGTRVAAVGAATAQQLASRGIVADFVPDEYNSEAVLTGLSSEVDDGTAVLLPRSDIASPELPRGLAELGAGVVCVDAYRTSVGMERAGPLVDKLRQGGVDAVTFTSSSTVRNFVRVLRTGMEENAKQRDGAEDLEQLLRGVVLAAIGPKTAATARTLGLEVTCQAREASIDSLVQTVREALDKDEEEGS